MLILVEDFNSNVVFEGEADDYLFQNENNEELENILDDLERMNFGDSISVMDDNGNDLNITKVDELMY